MIKNDYLLEGQETQRLFFRKLTSNDFDTWVEFFKDPLSNKYWKSNVTDAKQLCTNWFSSAFFRYENNTGGMHVLIEKASGKFVGQCGLLIQVIDGVELEVGYSIMPEFRGKGFAAEASQKCIQHAFEKNLKDSVISIIHVDNVESEKVALKNKMVLDRRTIYNNNPVNIYRIRRS